ncbi:MAG: NRDE family protein, partial [Gemmatimonadales bacterium]
MVGSLQVIAPSDGNHGGTWIGVNEAGLTVAVANRYQVPRPPVPAERISRGLLVMELLGQHSLPGLERALPGRRLEQYEPFTLVGLAPGSLAHLWSWDGGTLVAWQQEQPGLLLASSAIDQEAAASARRDTFAQAAALGPLDPKALAAIHASHRPVRGPLSVCMHREDASTVSFTMVTVGRGRISLAHANGPPCVTPLAPPMALETRG